MIQHYIIVPPQRPCELNFWIFFSSYLYYKLNLLRFLASLVVELGEYDISGATEQEYMSTREMAVRKKKIKIETIAKVGKVDICYKARKNCP